MGRADLEVLAQRAIWLRLLPMRATCRVRSRSTAAVHVRVRAMACCISADSDTPAATALARQSANSTGDPPSGSTATGEGGRAPLPRTPPERGPPGGIEGVRSHPSPAYVPYGPPVCRTNCLVETEMSQV